MLAHWRRGARERLPEIRTAARSRHELMGELAHLSVPDLKEAEGGLRDATTLRGLVATWLVDVPTPSSSGAGSRCSTCATWCMRSPGGPPTGSAPRCGSPLAEALALRDDRAAQVHVRYRRTPDHPPLAARAGGASTAS